MSDYLNGVIDKMSTNEAALYIEKRDKVGWFLFDVNKTKETTQFMWSKQSNVCLAWLDKAAVERFMSRADIYPNSVNIIKILEKE